MKETKFSLRLSFIDLANGPMEKYVAWLKIGKQITSYIRFEV